MGKRKRIGLSFVFNNESNSGVVNYILSIIRAFALIEEDERPELTIFYSENTPLEQIREIKYPDIVFYHLPEDRYPKAGIKRVINSLLFRLAKKRIFENKISAKQVDYVFPVFPFDFYYSEIPNKIHWMVDFNAYYYPGHYQDGGKWFFDWHTAVSRLNETVVVSSYTSLNDFKKFYPDAKNKVKILRFSAMLPKGIENEPIDVLIEKYGIERPFFITPNQFWEHKNHINLLKAWKIVIDKGYVFHLVLTGSPKVTRGLGFQYDILKEYVLENHLDEYIHFLGIIERNHQLALIKIAEAIIQPSLFEGWSTLVEESKAMDKFILLSDIEIHREQINKNAIFFNPYSPEDIADKIIRFYNSRPEWIKVEYSLAANDFAKDLLAIFE